MALALAYPERTSEEFCRQGAAREPASLSSRQRFPRVAHVRGLLQAEWSIRAAYNQNGALSLAKEFVASSLAYAVIQ